MIKVRKSMIAAIAMLSIGSAAMAAPAPETAQPHAYAATKFDPVKRAERIEQRQQTLHDALKLTANQEPAWNTYIAATKPQPRIGRADRVSFKYLNAPQRMEKRLELSKARIAQQETRLEVLKTFYAVLTPEQQKTFDQQGAGGKGKLHRHHRHG